MPFRKQNRRVLLSLGALSLTSAAFANVNQFEASASFAVSSGASAFTLASKGGYTKTNSNGNAAYTQLTMVAFPTAVQLLPYGLASSGYQNSGDLSKIVTSIPSSGVGASDSSATSINLVLSGNARHLWITGTNINSTTCSSVKEYNWTGTLQTDANGFTYCSGTNGGYLSFAWISGQCVQNNANPSGCFTAKFNGATSNAFFI